MTDAPCSLYQRVGGAGVISRLIDGLYARVLQDPELEPFFRQTSIDRLRAMQAAFLAAALDGPGQPDAFSLARAHQGRGIQRRHLQRFVGHLMDVLDAEQLVSRRDAMEVIFRIATYADDITGDTPAVDA